MAYILLVEDEEQVRKLLGKHLSKNGHEIEEAVDGEDALAKYSLCKPDLLITDILMPVKGGLSLIMDIKRSNPDQKILAISGGGKDGRLNFLSTARTFEGVRTLKKPFDLEDFSRTISIMLQSSGSFSVVV